MKWTKTKLCMACLLALSAAGCQRHHGKAGAIRPGEIAGTYELVEHRLANGTALRKPLAAGIYTMAAGRASLNLFLHRDDGTLASESSIIRYTIDDSRYCEWIDYTTRKDLDAPGVTNQTPRVTVHCAPVTITPAGLAFDPPGESVSVVYDRDGFTATMPGEFTDRWRKIG